MVIRVAFPLFGRGGWTGGYNYLKNTLRLINAQLSDEIEAWVFLSPTDNAEFGDELRSLVDGRVIVDLFVGSSGRGLSLVKAIILGRDAQLERILQSRGIDVVFENANFYGRRFSIPVISWIPDFQHRHMPEMFTTLNWWRRDLGFKHQIKSGRTILLSSYAALKDLEYFYPTAKGNGNVVRFAVCEFDASHRARGEELRRMYDLPGRYFFLPNQFWRHKNHAIVLEALSILRSQEKLEAIPPVILTGQPKDVRNPNHFEDLMTRAKYLQVDRHFRYLGLIPHDHVLALNANCLAMINPSLFEGWSTPVEEAKAFATPLILSDIPIHREQSPDASFFDPNSANALAALLMDAASRRPAPRPTEPKLRILQSARLEDHAKALLETIRLATSTY
jgi:glycosyltransferase involved in cell wall biosynthesis